MGWDSIVLLGDFNAQVGIEIVGRGLCSVSGLTCKSQFVHNDHNDVHRHWEAGDTSTPGGAAAHGGFNPRTITTSSKRPAYTC